MGLHGSEYWTYFLPKRVGEQTAKNLTDACMPISAKTAKSLGMIDEIISADKGDFLRAMQRESDILAEDNWACKKIRKEKMRERTPEWYLKVENHRNHELRIMRENFSSEEYKKARQAFVYKTPANSTPVHLMLRQNHQGTSLFSQESARADRPPALMMDGRKVAKSRTKELVRRTDLIKTATSGDVVPKMAIVIVSGNADSEKYVEMKQKTGNNVGVVTELYRFERKLARKLLEKELIQCVEDLSNNDDINGIIVQLPLPLGVNKDTVLAAISPEKDVDGLRTNSLGYLAGGIAEKGATSFIPCTAKGIISMLDYYSVPLMGKKACIIGRSTIVGLPVQLLLMKRGATVTTCDINTINLESTVKEADIIVAAAGSPSVVKGNWIKPGAVVIDAGIHVIPQLDTEGNVIGKPQIIGDVDSEAKKHALLMTPVPGGVGPMTIQMLLENTVDACIAQQKKKSTLVDEITEEEARRGNWRYKGSHTSEKRTLLRRVLA